MQVVLLLTILISAPVSLVLPVISKQVVWGQGLSGLSLRDRGGGGGRGGGFTPATKNVAPGYFHRKME